MKRRDFLGAAALPWAVAGCNTAAPITGGFVGASLERGHVLRGELGHQAKSGKLPAPSQTFRCRVLIAGGGVAGLAAARALRLRGVDDFALLELEDAAGGNSRGGSVNGIACPLGAHYLPVPGDHARDVQDLLEELGVRQRVGGRWTYDERTLCHSPQERLFVGDAATGEWQDGLLPQPGSDGVDAAAAADYARFAALVQQATQAAYFTIPVSNKPLAHTLLVWDAMTFEAWLKQHQLRSPALRWYLDYCCRDDYGAGVATVSAWAGLHYFASRHGFTPPGEEPAQDKDAGVLTWPQGNGWLTQQLAAPLGERLHTGRVVLRIDEGKGGVVVDALNVATQQIERWQAEHCIVALPLFIVARVVRTPPAALQPAASSVRYAPWLVANLHLTAPLHDRPGAAPSWDNVIYQAGPSAAHGQSLGYVDARHQSLDRVPGATVLTHYRAFGTAPAQRQALYDQPWTHWRDALLAELAVPHPDLPAKVSRIELMRYGHAMATPVPGTRANAALQALQQRTGRLQFAHSDLSGYSVFEEAFAQGMRAGRAVPVSPVVKP